MLANQWAVPYINHFRVYKDEQIPTHAVLELTLENKNEQEESTYVRTLPSLQKLFDEEMQKRGEGKTHKEQQELRKEEQTKLKGCMDRELLHRSDTFQKHKGNEDTDAYWASWSEAVEKGWLTYLGHKGAIRKALLGRGRTVILSKTPGRARKIKDEK